MAQQERGFAPIPIRIQFPAHICGDKLITVSPAPGDMIPSSGLCSTCIMHAGAHAFTHTLRRTRTHAHTQAHTHSHTHSGAHALTPALNYLSGKTRCLLQIKMKGRGGLYILSHKSLLRAESNRIQLPSPVSSVISPALQVMISRPHSSKKTGHFHFNSGKT